MTDHRDPASIEANIEQDRAAFASTLGALEDRISVDRLAEDALSLIRTNAAAYTKSVDRAVRSNPMALALIGAGVAWLVLGKRQGNGSRKPEAISRWEDEGGRVTPAPHTAQANDQADWVRKIEQLRDAASEKLHGIAEASRQTVDQTRDYAAEKAAIVSGLASDMASGFKHGLDDLSDATRDKIVTARQKAYQARQSAALAIKNSARAPGSMIEEHPLIAGAIAVATGAAIAASLPRSDLEDRLLGKESDRLMAEAAEMLRHEFDKAATLAGEVKDDMTDAAREAFDKVAGVAEDAAERVKAKTFGQEPQRADA